MLQQLLCPVIQHSERLVFHSLVILFYVSVLFTFCFQVVFLGNIRYLIQVKYGHCFRNLKFQSLWRYHRMVRYRKQMLCICCRREIKVNFSLMNRTQNLMWNHQKPLNLSKECMNSQQIISRCT